MATRVLHCVFSNNLIYLIFFLQFHIILDSKDVEDYVEPKQEQVVVRAVFINCEANEDQSIYPDNEATRFQREELFKHSSLQGCRKKLALTLKVSNEPENTAGDEYIPIEHVFDGPNKKRIRLLDPYILRIRREPPLQAYKLRLMEAVSGIIDQSDDRKLTKIKKMRVQRESEDLSDDNDGLRISELSNSTEMESTKGSCGLYEESVTNNTEGSVESQQDADSNSKYDRLGEDYQIMTGRSRGNDNIRVKRDVCTANSPAWKRDKRNEHNIIVEDSIDDEKIPLVAKERFYQKHSHARDGTKIVEDTPKIKYDDNKHLTKKTIETKSHPHSSENRNIEKDTHHLTSFKKQETQDQKAINDNFKDTKKFASPISREEHVTRRYTEKEHSRNSALNYNTDEANYALYEIGKPELLYSVQVQLFEKMSTPEGKTVWNDITNGEIASVSSVEPEWKGQDLNVKYRSTEWVTKDKFSLPSAASLCLLVSMNDETAKSSDEDNDNLLRRFIVVPMDDIVNLGNDNVLSKRDENYSQYTTEPRGEQSPRRVLVRVSRAFPTGSDDLKISSQGSDHFLLMPYRRLHRAQIDLEARADDNELIRVGSSGSLITIVADNSRRTRSTITVQASNKGLAAARFKVKTRDCGPELTDLMEKAGEQLTTTGPVLIAPRHTHRFVLELPVEIPLDVARCSVALINDEDESVAVREVAIRKGDRCFCVWHCDCVCLNEDPKLLCREMAEAHQTAAGLPARGRPRRARFACYPDILCVNVSVLVVGVLVLLLMLGLLKATLGLICRCVGVWGLHRLIQTPRKLDCYYEGNLRNRPVIYDDAGFPVHPDTRKRTVRMVSKEMEFALNVIFFVAVPSLMLWDAIKLIRCAGSQIKKDVKQKGDDAKKCFSTPDMQGKQRRWHRRHVDLQKWMTKPAEEVTADVWERGLNTQVKCEFILARTITRLAERSCIVIGRHAGHKNKMLPLLAERKYRPDELSSCVDSEQDDTEYVLTQMQKSKESLAKSQRKINDTEPSTTVTKQLNAETNVYH